jgi:hypothetical protein
MLQFNTQGYCEDNNRKLKGSIDPKIINKYQGKEIGTPQVSQAMVPADTKPFRSNRSSKGSKIQEYITENNGFDWRLYASPIVGRLPNGDLYVIDGEHRFNMANIFLPHLKKLPVVIVEFDNEKQMADAFWKKNGGFTTRVSNETQLISQWHSDTPTALRLGKTCADVGIVVAEDIDNFVPNSYPSNWKIKVRALEATIKIAGKKTEAIKQAVELYKTAFNVQKKKAGNQHIEMTSQLIQALVFIYQFKAYEDWMKKNPTLFADWFIDLVATKPVPKKHLYEVEYPHERMEQRYLGTAYGLIQDFFGTLRANNVKNVPSPKEMRTAYQAHKDKKQEQKQTD